MWSAVHADVVRGCVSRRAGLFRPRAHESRCRPARPAAVSEQSKGRNNAESVRARRSRRQAAAAWRITDRATDPAFWGSYRSDDLCATAACEPRPYQALDCVHLRAPSPVRHAPSPSISRVRRRGEGADGSSRMAPRRTDDRVLVARYARRTRCNSPDVERVRLAARATIGGGSRGDPAGILGHEVTRLPNVISDTTTGAFGATGAGPLGVATTRTVVGAPGGRRQDGRVERLRSCRPAFGS